MIEETFKLTALGLAIDNSEKGRSVDDIIADADKMYVWLNTSSGPKENNVTPLRTI